MSLSQFNSTGFLARLVPDATLLLCFRASDRLDLLSSTPYVPTAKALVEETGDKLRKLLPTARGLVEETRDKELERSSKFEPIDEFEPRRRADMMQTESTASHGYGVELVL